ncbi:MAG: efflux RND transporter permease subunit [Carboxylicivirga sp.]|jgi:multidrug efflux pump subunit AcrB|nr:efflux RND transporter permease subunit [Carboxylicivirga sp.]
MVKFLIHRPIAVIMTFIAILLLGGVAAGLLPVSLMPDIDIPEITVQVNYSGKSVQEIESGVVRKLRQGLMQVPHLDDLSSESYEGKGTIKLRFNYGADINYAFIDVNEQVDAAMRSLPKDLDRPAIIKASATDLPVFYINAWLKDSIAGVSQFMDLCDLCKNVVVKRIEQLPQVALVDVTGQLEPELYILPKEEKVKPLGITQGLISKALEQNNISLGSLQVIDGQYKYNIRFTNSLRSVEDVKNIYLKANHRILQLKDIAEIGIRPKEREGAFVSDKQLALSLAVIKQSDARMEELRAEVKRLLWIFKRDYNNVAFEVVRDQTELLQYTITNLRQSLIIGALLAFVIMFFFLKDARSPWLVGLSIPVSVVISILFFQVIGLSINIISLSGLILGVGMMIDNSIVVIDNISQHLERGERLANACIKGTTEVIRPLISSVLTTCAVFLPLIFISGIAGALFYDQALAVAIGLVVSLLVSTTLLPTLFRLFWLNRENKAHVKGGRFSAWLHALNLFKVEDLYERGFRFVFKKRGFIFSGFILLILISIYLGNILPKERFPQFRQAELLLKVDWNDKISVDENLKRSNKIIDVCDSLTLLSNAFVGSQQYILHKDMDLSSSETIIYLSLKKQDHGKQIEHLVGQYLMQHYPGAVYNFSAPETIFEKLFAEKSSPLEIRVSANNKKGIPAIEETNQVISKINELYAWANVKPVPIESFIEIRVRPELLALYDVDQNKLYSRLKSAINSFQIGVLRTGSQYIPIVVSDKKSMLEDILKELKIRNSKGLYISVASLVKLVTVNDYKLLYGGKQGAFVPLKFETLNESPDSIIPQIMELMKQYGTVNLSFVGSWFSTRELIKQLFIVLMISLALLYFILAAQFESFSQPLIVLIEVPIDIAGAFAMLWFFGSSINLMAMIGIVVMSGIIINDSILKIDTINRLRKDGLDLMQAIETAGYRRIKSIIMTSLTTILALVPFLWGDDTGSELQKPLALTVIGSMALGTLVSLYFVPLCYYYLHKGSKLQSNTRNLIKTTQKR